MMSFSPSLSCVRIADLLFLIRFFKSINSSPSKRIFKDLQRKSSEKIFREDHQTQLKSKQIGHKG